METGKLMELNRIYKIYFKGNLSSFYEYKKTGKFKKEFIHCFTLLEDPRKKFKIKKIVLADMPEYYREENRYIEYVSKNRLNSIKGYELITKEQKAFDDWLNNSDTINWLLSHGFNFSSVYSKLILAGCWEDAWNEGVKSKKR